MGLNGTGWNGLERDAMCCDVDGEAEMALSGSLWSMVDRTMAGSSRERRRAAGGVKDDWLTG